PERKPPRHHRADRGARTRRGQRARAGVRHALCRARVGDLRSAGAGIRPDPWRGGVQHLVRLMGRARALEVMLSAEDYDAELAERYGWINRALPALKDRINAIALAPAEDFRRDSDLFGEASRSPETQSRFGAAMES